MIDHTGINVTDFEKSKAFYSAALAPLGYTLLMQFADDTDVAGFGIAPKADFWIVRGATQKPPVHIAFRAATRQKVDAFYEAAISAGGKDNGKPGLRPHIMPIIMALLS